MKFRNVSIFKPKRRRKSHHPWLIAVSVNGQRQVTSGSTSRADTETIAEHLSRLAQRIEHSIADPSEMRREIERRKPLTAHLNAYEKFLKSSGMTKKHALQMRLYAEEATEQFATVDAIVASEIQAKIFSLDVGAVTKNRRMYAVSHFLSWGVGDDRWPREVADRVKLSRLTQAKIRPRRVLTLDELIVLIQAAEIGDTVSGVTGLQRALMYRTLVATGLRFGELTRICKKHVCDTGFDLTADLTKNRKPAFITLPANLMIDVQLFVQHRRADELLFPIPKFNPDRLLKHDLAAAGIARLTDRGVFDFHSLRHQCATLLAASGAKPKLVQEHMRHSSIKLTLDTYGHLFDNDRIRAAEVMGEMVQRRAHLPGANMPNKTPVPQWSDGESNPDLLNAIQASENLIEIRSNELRNKRGKRVARGAAPKLLNRFYRRAIRRASRGAQ